MMFDTFIWGQISQDINVNCDGTEVREIGGAVVYSGHVAANLGHRTAVLPKGATTGEALRRVFARARGIEVFPVAGGSDTSIQNVYHTPDKERRTSSVISRIEPYRAEEIPEAPAKIIHIAGLMRGDLGDELIPLARERAMVALDVQGVLRCEEDGTMVFHDWADKMTYLPMIRFLKTDALEAQVMTGLEDRAEAARMLHGWGAGEVMITHNTEVLVFDGERITTQPIRARNLSGRSGRGDTCFSAYITERLTQGPEAALLLAAAVVSLKMEQPGPFVGDRADVEAYIKEFY